MFGMRKSRKVEAARTEEERMMDALRAHTAGCVVIADVQIGDRRYPRTLVERQTVRDCAGGGDVAPVERGIYSSLWRCGVCGMHLVFEHVPRAPAPAAGATDAR